MIDRAKKLLMGRSRERKIKHFFSLFTKGMTVLDVGVHGGKGSEDLPATNQFLNSFPYDDATYTGLGVDDLSAVAQAHPGKTFVRYSGDVIPFDDKSFDFVFSNAVIEHVGDDAAQLNFLNEMLRVGKRVFLTTPNKFFPVDAHTNTLFLHWVDPVFYAWCRRFHGYWTPDNLNLLPRNGLNALLRRSNADTWKIYNNKILGLTMTFTATCE